MNENKINKWMWWACDRVQVYTQFPSSKLHSDSSVGGTRYCVVVSLGICFFLLRNTCIAFWHISLHKIRWTENHHSTRSSHSTTHKCIHFSTTWHRKKIYTYTYIHKLYKLVSLIHARAQWLKVWCYCCRCCCFYRLSLSCLVFSLKKYKKAHFFVAYYKIK